MAYTTHKSPPRTDTSLPQPGANDPLGSTGRPTFDPTNPGKSAAAKPKETDGLAKFRQSQNQGDTSSKLESNKGLGRVGVGETTKDIPKSG